MEGHIVGTGVSVPAPPPLQAKCFGKAGAYDGRRWIGGQSRKETEQREGFLCYCGCNSPFPSKLFLYCPLSVCLCVC